MEQGDHQENSAAVWHEQGPNALDQLCRVPSDRRRAGVDVSPLKIEGLTRHLKRAETRSVTRLTGDPCLVLLLSALLALTDRPMHETAYVIHQG